MEADVNIRVVSTLRKGIKEKVNLEEVAAGKASQPPPSSCCCARLEKGPSSSFDARKAALAS